MRTTIKQTKEKLIRWNYFDSVNDALTSQPAKPYARQSLAVHPNHSGSTQWFGCKVEDLDGNIKDGWQDGIDLVNKLPEAETTNMRSVRRRRHTGATGSSLRPLSLISGDLRNAWVKHERSERFGAPRRVTIITNASFSSMEKAADLAWQGAAVARITDTFERSGVRVRLIIATAATGCNDGGVSISIGAMVTAKEFDMPMDIASIASTVVLPGFVRRYIYQHYHSEEERYHDRSLGMPSLLSHPDFNGMINEESDEKVFYAPKIRSQWEAENWVKNMGAEFGA